MVLGDGFLLAMPDRIFDAAPDVFVEGLLAGFGTQQPVQSTAMPSDIAGVDQNEFLSLSCQCIEADAESRWHGSALYQAPLQLLVW